MTTPPRTEWIDSADNSANDSANPLDRPSSACSPSLADACAPSPDDARIPTNLITGFLGVGKTTALLELLRSRPPHSRWAVLVNEYGEVPIDGALLEDAERGTGTSAGAGTDTGTATPGSGGLSIREVGGGCICCASSLQFRVALVLLLQQVRPERLLIETSGVSHPARILDILRRDFSDRLRPAATICLIDPRDFARPPMRQSAVFEDQIQLADVLVLNKLDLAPPELVQEFTDWAQRLDPPKQLIVATERGRLDPAWLDVDRLPVRRPLHPDAHAASAHAVTDHADHADHAGHADTDDHAAAHAHAPRVWPTPRPGEPACCPSPAGDACGWLFTPTDQFDETRLLRLLTDPGIDRLKGIFHTTDGEWLAVNRTGATMDVRPTTYRRDSRLEVFARWQSADWQRFDQQLRACLSGAQH
jgi:G3E family GTPase